MAGEIPITLAVEDELSEHLLRALLAQTNRDYLVGAVYGKRGNNFLKQKLSAFNNAAKGSACFCLTDLDSHPCAPALIEEWFGCGISEYDKRRHPNLIFRVAVREVEAWVMADREQFANFLGVSKQLIPSRSEDSNDPKTLLLQIAAKSRRRDLRDDIVPQPGENRKLGPNYNGRLGQFVQEHWRAEAASINSVSLAKTWHALKTFQPIYKIMRVKHSLP